MRKDIKESLLSRKDEAGKYAAYVKEHPGLSEEEVIHCVHSYICCKFLLDTAESDEMSMLALSKKSIEKALELKIPVAKESERATTCGAAGTVAMKVGLLMLALQKDFEMELNPGRLGMAKNTREIGKLVFEKYQAAYFSL